MALFVLVHGAFEGGWCWQRVARLLRAAGHDVYTPTLTGSGERFHLLSRDVTLAMHIEDVSAVLRYEDLRDVILVGHSYAGTVVTGVADRERARVKQVIYLDASAPVDGQSASGAFAEGTADKLEEMSASEGWLLPPLPVVALGVTAPADVALLEARRHPHPMRTLMEPLRLTHGELDVPRSYIVCTEHNGLVDLFGVDPLLPFVERAQREGWDVHEIRCGHDAMLIDPGSTARVLLFYA
jgi:pimeloyl-ACP methyl ester carboxylesterase